MKNNAFNKIKELIPIIIFLGIIAALFYSIYYSSKLEEQIWERDRTIQELSFRSKLVEDYFDIKYNPDDSTTSYILKDSIRNRFSETYKNRNDVLQGNYESLANEYNSLIHDYNEIIDEYNSMVAEANSLIKENMRIKEEKCNFENVLGMIESKYKITYNISVDSKNIIIKLKNTDMVDSAMVLLPFYRDKIERKPNGLWIVTH